MQRFNRTLLVRASRVICTLLLCSPCLPPPGPYNSCNSGSVSLGGQIPSIEQNPWFQSVGQGNNPTDCGSNSPQTGSTGTCSYATNIDQAQGQH
jgi:hypothetical protein